MKKSIIIGIIIFTFIISIAFVLSMLIVDENISAENIKEAKEIYNQNSRDVDEGVNKFMSSKEYNKMNKDEQIKLVGYLLELYEDSLVIKNLHYDESALMYTFTYNYGDTAGALGGVMLKDWNPMMNKLK